MALRFAMSGGNLAFSKGAQVAGLWTNASPNLSIANNAPAGTPDSYAFRSASTSAGANTPNLGTFTALIAGFRIYPLNTNAVQLISFRDASGNSQCELNTNGTGQLKFTRNGTPIGGISSFAITPNAWTYVEFKAIFATAGGGTCEVQINGQVVLTSTGLINATTTNTASVVGFGVPTIGGYGKDFYVVDTGSGINTSYLGDITVAEIYPNGAGAHSQWTPNVGPFTLTSVNTTGVYQGTITGGVSNAYQGYYFNVTGFVNGANNQSNALCTASTATSITIGTTTVTETHAGSAAFQCIVQPGIHGGFVDLATTNVGTRPNDDVTFISDSTVGHISDFSHQTLVLASGTIAGVVHQTYAKKDDAGSRNIQQTSILGGSTETSGTIALGTSYQYYQDVLETDPASNPWTISNFNNATFGVKVV